MKSLNLNVKNGMRIYLDTIMFQNIFCKADFVLVFDVHKLLLRSLIIHIKLQLADLRKICDPVRTDMICYPVCQKLISVKEETSLGDAVCFVVEFFRHHLIEILQFLIFQDLCMQSGNTVYGKSCNNGKMSHFYLAVINNGHFLDLLIVARIFCLDLKDKSAVDLLNNLIYTGKQSGEQLDRPFFQRFGHNGMIGVRNTFCCNLPCLVPSKTFLIHKDTHQLCNSYCRMSIVHLEYNFFIQLTDIAVIFLVLLDCSLKTCGNKEVLLFQTQLLTCHMVVVRIKHLNDIAGKVFLLYSFLVITLVKRIQSEVYDRLCIPDAESIYDLIVISQDRHVKRHCLYCLISLMDKSV